jgi:hypothetical protein
MRKKVQWDKKGLKKALKKLVYAAHYNPNHIVDVKFVKKNNRVHVRSSSILSKMANDTCSRILCVLTCLWTVFLPLWLVVRKKVDKQLVAYYHYLITPEEFYQHFSQQIYKLAMNRARGDEIIADMKAFS